MFHPESKTISLQFAEVPDETRASSSKWYIWH
jgi:hypothetical protein